jgi:antitoxin PrlF
MTEATLTSKSQLTLPKTVRDSLGIGPGDRIRFVPSLNGFRIVAMKGDITKLRGMFKGRRAEPLSIEEMGLAVAESAVKRFERAK